RELYLRCAGELKATGKAYPCYCSAEELKQRREEQLARGESPRYDRRCRGLDTAARARLEAEGRVPALRFALEETGEVAWNDDVRGQVSFQGDVLEDFVLLRSDGLPTYNFAVVVDDH